ncbi:MAG: ABC transporter ATP-binding protein [Rhodospirillales bacterium]|nr:ABC transporter ATP-binding protein [Rhodospirillales bacterium]
MLMLEGIGRRFADRGTARGVEALADISLAIAEGEFLALLGPSGCGKSTLLRLIAGLDRPDGGRIVWAGGAAPPAGQVGFVFQDATLLPWASAAENVFLPLRLAGLSWDAAKGRVRDALGAVGLDGFAEARPHALSGGMRMRVSIARALVTRPRLLLMDEPFAALDEFTRHRLQADLRALWLQAGCTVIFVTHSIYEAAFLARRVVLMSPRPGRIASEIAGLDQPEGAARRMHAAYAALVGRISARMEEIAGGDAERGAVP